MRPRFRRPIDRRLRFSRNMNSSEIIKAPSAIWFNTFIGDWVSELLATDLQPPLADSSPYNMSARLGMPGDNAPFKVSEPADTVKGGDFVRGWKAKWARTPSHLGPLIENGPEYVKTFHLDLEYVEPHLGLLVTGTDRCNNPKGIPLRPREVNINGIV